MAADLAGSRLLTHRADRTSERLRVGEWGAQNMEGEPFGGAWANAWEARERLN
jgi:hypothetical protein